MIAALWLSLATTIIPVGRGVGFVAIADVNGDRRPDIIVANMEEETVSVLLNDGGRRGARVGTRQMFAVGKRPYERLRTADFNQDGRPDLVTTNLDDQTVTILLGDGKGDFTQAPGSPVPAGPAPWQVAIDDING